MSNRSKRLDEIRAEAELFFEWPGDDRSTVTLTSCILFADHIASLVTKAVVMPEPFPIHNNPLSAWDAGYESGYNDALYLVEGRLNGGKTNEQ